MTSTPSTDTRCCPKCLKSKGALSKKQQKEFGGICGTTCDCHWKESEAGHTEPKEGWLDHFNTQFVVEGRLKGNHLIVKDFITETIAKEVEKAKQEGAKELVAQIRGKTALLTSVDWEDLQDFLTDALVEYLRPHKLK